MFKHRLLLLITLGGVWSNQACAAPEDEDFTLKSLPITAAPESVPIL